MWRSLIVLVVACGGVPDKLEVAQPAPRARETCRDEPPVGDPSQLTLRTVPNFMISPPQTCKEGSYIRIERTIGARKIAVGRDASGGFGAGCTDLANWALCKDAINPGTLLQQAAVELRVDKIDTADLGGGPCAPNLAGDYSGWNFAVGVHDWKNADKLVAKITELMDRYDVAGYVGASVYTIPCAVAL